MSEPSRPADLAVHCEVVKVALNQTKDGYKLVLALHPSEAPEELLRSFVGTRYMMALVEMDSVGEQAVEPEPTPPSGQDDAREYVKYAALLCKEPAFQRWMFMRGYCLKPDEEHAAEALRTFLEISSRSELLINKEARDKLDEISKAYLRGA